MLEWLSLLCPAGPTCLFRRNWATRIWIALLFAMHVAPASADALSEAFVDDPTFNSGYLIDDRFATSYLYNDFYARKIARLSNGDVVAVGLVPAAYQVDQGNGLFNVGLVRYGANGERVPWPAPTPAYISFYDRYIQYPNSYSYYDRIADVRVVNGFIYVLADYLLTPLDRYPHLIVFGEGGNFIGLYSAGTIKYESGVGMVSFVSGGVRKLFSVNQATAIVSEQDGGVTRLDRYLRLNRFDIAADGSISDDAAFGSGGVMSLSDPGCTVSTGYCDISAAAISLVGSGNAILGPYLVYAIGDTHCSAPSGTFCAGDFPLQILRLSPQTGALLSRSTVFLNDPASGNAGLDSRARDIVATRSALVGGGFSDAAYALASATGHCIDENNVYADYRRGAALLRIDGNGDADGSFAGSGVLLFGGPSGPSCPPSGTPTAEPKALALGAYSRLAVVGSTSDKANSPTHSDGFLAVVRVDREDVADEAVHPALMFGGQPWGSFAGFEDVIAYDGGTFSATGPVTTGYNAYQFGTTRFISDRIFADDFSSP